MAPSWRPGSVLCLELANQQRPHSVFLFYDSNFLGFEGPFMVEVEWECCTPYFCLECTSFRLRKVIRFEVSKATNPNPKIRSSLLWEYQIAHTTETEAQ
ncbi:hypothetical protein Ahy_B01g052018 isoform F [Arachis hypogaea]|uniref:Uncharacterized protein n=1 Tax=Arachis hypogaea TaxID=3818 RepID=A0A445ANI8_ARAHY|nr:hypothetical protein Ahy_B01g052018 isoform F [Arachis hypogaea]